MHRSDRGPMIFSDDFPCKGHFSYRTLFEEGPERYGNWAIKTTHLPDGRLLMVWGSTSGKELDPTNRLWIAFSIDDGITWSNPQLFADSTAETRVLNPCCYTHDNGRLFIFYNFWPQPDARAQVRYQTSDDSGSTWGEPLALSQDSCGLMSSPIRLESGAILLPTYRQVDDQRSGRSYVAFAFLSADGGRTWKRGGDIALSARDGVTEPSIAQTRQGALYCIMRTKMGCQYQCWSEDEGLTWTRPEPSPFASPEACAILWRLANGNLVAAWDNTHVSGGSHNPRYPLFVALSEDPGRTWPYQKMVQTTDGWKHLSNHGLYQTASGAILLPVNHLQGIWNGAEHGPVELARFDEDWIRSDLSADKWEQQPSPTGGIRLDNDGVLLVSGAWEGDQTLLCCKMRLPENCVVEYEVTDEQKHPDTQTGLFVGSPPYTGYCWLTLARTGIDHQTPAVSSAYYQCWDPACPTTPIWRGHYYDATTVRLTFKDGQVQYEDSAGAKGDWLNISKDMGCPMTWGFFARNAGVQSRLRVRKVGVWAG